MAPTIYKNKTIKLTKACSNSSIDTSVKYKLNPSTHPGTLIKMRFVIQNGKAQGMMVTQWGISFYTEQASAFAKLKFTSSKTLTTNSIVH